MRGEFWWVDNYVPTQALILEQRERHAADDAVLAGPDVHQREMRIHRRHGAFIGSAHVVMQKVPAERARPAPLLALLQSPTPTR